MNYLAQKITNPVTPELSGKSGVSFIQSFVPALVGIAFSIGAIVFLFVMITGAIQWITSGGDKAALESARGKIANAIIGIVVLMATFAVIKLVESFFGINILTIDIGPLQIK
jgi:hypothetical protein